MFSKSTFLNLTLAIIASLLTYRAYQAWVSPPPAPGVGEQGRSGANRSRDGPPQPPVHGGGRGGGRESKEARKSAEQKPSKGKKIAQLPLTEYQKIGQKNLFRPEREEWVPPPPVSAETPQLPPPSSFRLYGIVTMPDGSSMALIEESTSPANPTQRPIPQIRRRLPFPRPETRSEASPVKRVWVNESIGGYRVAEIQHDKIILDGGGRRVKVFLRDPDNPKQRPAAPAVAMAPTPMPSTVGAQPTPSPFPTSESPQIPQPPAPPGTPPRGPTTFQPPSATTQNPPPARGRQVIPTPSGPRVIYR